MSSMRTNYCGLVTEELLGQTVSLCGWYTAAAITAG
jgi:aspartyl-tRNA synthetase